MPTLRPAAETDQVIAEHLETVAYVTADGEVYKPRVPPSIPPAPDDDVEGLEEDDDEGA